MSGSGDDVKESLKAVPLDLARSQITAVRTVDGKTPLLMTGQTLRGKRVFSQATPTNSGQSSTINPTIITTSIVPQAVFKQETGRAQIASILTNTQQQQQQQQQQGSASITIQQRPTQITLSTAPVVPCGTTYHVPRGPAVVANLAAPRANVGSVRTPMVVAATAQSTTQLVKIQRAPSPATQQNTTAWLTATNNSLKTATTVLNQQTQRGGSNTSIKQQPQQLFTGPRTQANSNLQNVSTIRPTTAIIHSTIAIGQPGQIHPFKSGPNTTNLQTLGNAVSIAQVGPSRTQALVYNAQTNQFNQNPRLTVTNSSLNQRSNQIPRPAGQVTTARLTVPVNVSQVGGTTTRLVTPQATVLTSGIARTQQPTITTNRLMSTPQSNVAIGRLTVTPTQQVTNNTTNQLINQTRTLNLHSLVAVAANPSQTRTAAVSGGSGGGGASGANSSNSVSVGQTGQVTKVITQPTQGTIHFTQIPATVKNVPSNIIVTTANRTINVPSSAIVAQRQTTQTIPIANIYQQSTSDNSQSQGSGTAVVTAASGTGATNVYIHTPVSSVPRRTSPVPTCATQSNIPTTTTITTYSIAGGAYFYDASGNYSVARSFTPQSNTFTAISQQSTNTQQIRPSSVHGIVANPQMRFNQVMVVEPNRGQQQQQFSTNQQQSNIESIGSDQSQLVQQQQQPQQQQVKITSSPRPSILRKRDHEGTQPLKAAKNLIPVLSTLSQSQSQSSPVSPPLRPDSRGNCNSSGGSTTISATSSPGLAEVNEDSMPHVPLNPKEEENVKPPIEVTPRKKPRKQQLTGNDINEHNDDMQFISESSIKKEPIESDGNQSDEQIQPIRDGAPEASGQVTTVRKPASASLLNSYRQTWKSTHNHYMRYSDVRPKDERRPTIMDLANQYRIQDKVNGWKIYHLSTQMEDLAVEEQNVHNQLNELLKCTGSLERTNFEKEVNRINELILGNLQRIKIINEGMIESKNQIMKIFDHKVHVTDIINRCASKRNFKKREKL